MFLRAIVLEQKSRICFVATINLRNVGQNAVIELNKKGIYLSESNVSKLVGSSGYFRYKEVRLALKKARQDLGIK